ncbi:hypothetical protein [Ornithinimicrobium cryptoxanthini]|uniref:hypothetical protein n=1 Tax=Ornithinimicrobium cryptoxanthini TaxID=2934161 RepID=UPI002118B89C|nr:hypothetical protein [Ornithinimicrobium cryptoxanthini]
MSPKSKGRPKGRGRTPARRQSTRSTHDTHGAQRPVTELSASRRILQEARTSLSDDQSLLAVRLVASAWVGAVWGARSMGARDPEGALVTELVGELGGRQGRAAYLALEALQTIARDAWRDPLSTALAHSDQPRPAWARELDTPPAPDRAQFWSDPWGSETVYLLRYSLPEPHIVLVPISTVGGVMIQSIVVERDANPDETVGAMTHRGDIPGDKALAAVADGMFQTDMYWPPQDDPDYIVNRAYAHWLTQGHRRESDWEEVPDEKRQELLTAFQQEHGARLPHDAQVVELLADTFVDFGEGYLAGGVLAWSPGEVERFLLDWVQRKVILDPDDSAALPDVLREWVVFALRRKGVAGADIEPVVAVVDDLADDYRDDVGTSPKGPAAELLSRAMAEGIDLGDKEAMDRLIGAYNAEQHARRLLSE